MTPNNLGNADLGPERTREIGIRKSVGASGPAVFTQILIESLVLALLVYQRPNLLLLDEPTNHLDLEMRQALATALQEFDGAMVTLIDNLDREANVVVPDVPAANGVIHAIDAVVLPYDPAS